MGFYSFADVVSDVPKTLEALEGDTQMLSRLSSDAVERGDTLLEILPIVELRLRDTRNIIEALRRASIAELAAYPFELLIIFKALPTYVKGASLFAAASSAEERKRVQTFWFYAIQVIGGRVTEFAYLKKVASLASEVGASLPPGVMEKAEADEASRKAKVDAERAARDARSAAPAKPTQAGF